MKEDSNESILIIRVGDIPLKDTTKHNVIIRSIETYISKNQIQISEK